MMSMIHKCTVNVDGKPVHFEFEERTGGNGAIVALDATMEDFKGRPVKDNTGRDSLKYAARTTKDCIYIDGCIYLHLGHVADSEMVRLIGIFLEALKDKTLWSHEVPGLITTPKLKV